MPPSEDIQNGLSGAWRMMAGHPDGLSRLDLSLDGFWNSFFAIVVAFPALAVGWVDVANHIAMLDGDVGERVSLVIRFAVVDIGAWILPLCGLALVARRAGIADRFVHYVVATNWASAIIIWIMLPPQLVRMALPGLDQFSVLFSLALFLFTLFLLWRVTNAAIGRGPALATAVFCAMFVASLIVLFGLQSLLGIHGTLSAT